LNIEHKKGIHFLFHSYRLATNSWPGDLRG